MNRQTKTAKERTERGGGWCGKVTVHGEKDHIRETMKKEMITGICLSQTLSRFSAG